MVSEPESRVEALVSVCAAGWAGGRKRNRAVLGQVIELLLFPGLVQGLSERPAGPVAFLSPPLALVPSGY